MDINDVQKLERSIQEQMIQLSDMFRNIEPKRKELLRAEDEVRRRRSDLKKIEDKAYEAKHQVSRLQNMLAHVKAFPATIADINSGKIPGGFSASQRSPRPISTSAARLTIDPLAAPNDSDGSRMVPNVNDDDVPSRPSREEQEAVDRQSAENTEGQSGAASAKGKGPAMVLEGQREDGAKQKQKKRRADDDADESKHPRKKHQKKRHHGEGTQDRTEAAIPSVQAPSREGYLPRKKRLAKVEPQEVALS
ncbi:hypothetical protein CALVIDRAFT_536815 [Calocera viscosa TUFC12733]|uniref:Uncharacterized protein n=1 Tax=Calocera viscosa (strain TUFC12733) TaxID=1330018 RepID=A0A167MN83_CALVF|nr:hypothetical protein CALVIDRAFT_536815 [Calocera viscosa TUFC12733]